MVTLPRFESPSFCVSPFAIHKEIQSALCLQIMCYHSYDEPVFIYLISPQIPDTLLKLKLLHDLDLSCNSLTSLPAGLTKLRAMRRLNLAENQLTELPSDIGEFKNLCYLNASHNSLLSLPDVSRCYIGATRSNVFVASAHQ